MSPSKRPTRGPAFVVFDARYAWDPDRAAVMSTADTIEEAKDLAPDYGIGTVVVDRDGKVVYTVRP